MPTTKTITIEVPDYSEPVATARTYIDTCEAETKSLHRRNVACYDSIEEQILTYLRTVFMPLSNLPELSLEYNHGQAANVCIEHYNYSNHDTTNFIRFEYGLDATHWIVFDMNLVTGAVTHDSDDAGIGYQYRSYGKHFMNNRSLFMPLLIENWPTIKSIVSKWVADEINAAVASRQRALTEERILSANLSAFKV